MRRHPRPEKVREVLASAPPGIVAAEYGEEIVRLRGVIKQAADLLKHPDGIREARQLLTDTLARERWWR